MSEHKFDIIIGAIKELHQMTRAIHDRQEETDAKLEALTMDVHKLHGEVTSLKQDVSVLKVDVSVLKEDIAILKDDVQVLKEDVAVIKKTMATKDDLSYFDMKIGKHDRDIFNIKHQV